MFSIVVMQLSDHEQARREELETELENAHRRVHAGRQNRLQVRLRNVRRSRSGGQQGVSAFVRCQIRQILTILCSYGGPFSTLQPVGNLSD